MRRAHFIQPNHATQVPQNAIWFDTETTPDMPDPDTQVHRLSFGWAAYRRRGRGGAFLAPEWLRFETIRGFWEWVVSHTRPKTRLYLFCHNTSFDLPVLDCFGVLPALGFELKRACIDAPPTLLTFKRDTANITILDTLNIWRLPLAKIGEHIGLPKLPMPKPEDSREAWDTYGKRDVEIIMSVCIQWWDMLERDDLGGFAHTLAGQALRTYRHKYMRYKILAEDDPLSLEVSRAAYYGGRTECFFIGKTRRKLYLLDVNSMYPAVMKAHKYPSILAHRTHYADLELLERWLRDFCVCARVVLQTDEPCYPLKRDGKLLFPTGLFVTYLSTPELQHALSKGHILEVGDVCAYTPANLFVDFVTDMYARRLRAAAEGDHVGSWLYKILQNSLYGKFGQRGIVWSPAGSADDLTARRWVELDASTGAVIRWRQLAGLVQHQEDESESRDSVPAIAAHVTAHARMLLWSRICEAGRREVLYSDTDSLLVTRKGYQRLKRYLHPTELGALKLEGEYEDATIYGPKDYVFGAKFRCKGVRTSALWLDPNTIEQDKWSSLRGLLAAGSLDSPTTRRIVKRLRRSFDKGTVGRDGWVTPLVLT